MRLLLCAVFLVGVACGRDAGAVNKCCARDEYADSPSECRRVEEAAAADATDVWWWIDPALRPSLELDSLDGDNVTYGRKPDCRTESRTTLPMDEYTRLARVGDEIVLEVAVESSTGSAIWHVIPTASFCLDVGRASVHVAVVCPCAHVPCVRKCCFYRQEFDLQLMKCAPQQREESSDWLPGFDLDLDAGKEHRFFLMPYQNPACAIEDVSSMVLAPNDTNSQLGLVFLEDGGVWSNVTKHKFEKDQYCGDFTTDGVEYVITCMRKMSTKQVWLSTSYGVLFAVGSVALLLVVLVSLLLPEMRSKIHGRMALAHNVMLLVAYVSTGALHFIGSYRMGMTTVGIKVLGFVIQFSFLAAFFWLNVMCIDIFWVFSGLRPIQGTAMQREKKKFAYYSMYAWGATCLISIATVATELSPTASLRPAFGEGGGYFFNNNGAMLLFFYGPMATLLTVNMALFCYTAFKIYSVKQATAILHTTESTTNKKDTQRLALYAKLFCLMGVTWIFEVVSWAVGGDQGYWFLFDAVNLLRAVFVFVIFCCKKTVYVRVKARLLRMCGLAVPGGAGSTYSQDTRTTSSNLSRTTSHCTPVPNRKVSNVSRKLPNDLGSKSSEDALQDSHM